MLAATFGQMFVFYTISFVCIVGVAIAGVFVGKKLRDRKDKKEDNK